jgi:peptidoglycan hydrolase-like protein with peptidoglycan-binding domain
MKSTLLAASLLFAACMHPRHVETGGGDDGATAQRSAPQSSHEEGRPAAKARAARRPQRPGAAPLAASPGGLFVPGGVEQIQNALTSRGYLDLDTANAGEIDASTTAAIRKFQSDEGIARTGNPDHETVRRLGLDAERLFRKSSDAKDSKQP